jgi:hypothetical protein
MSDYDNNNRGAVWKNEKKATDKHPDFTGSLNVEGKEFWVSAWRSDGSNPKAPVLSFSVNAKEPMAQAPQKPAPAFDDDLSMDTPF